MFDFLKPHPSRSYLSQKFTICFVVCFLALTLVLYALAGQLVAILALASGLFIYILADMMANLRNDPPKKLWRKILAVFTCCFAACALCGMIVVLFRYALA